MPKVSEAADKVCVDITVFDIEEEEVCIMDLFDIVRGIADGDMDDT